MKRRFFLAGAGSLSLAALTHLQVGQTIAQALGDHTSAPAAMSKSPFLPVDPWAEKLINAAESQVGQTVRYDGAYVSLKYPGGDIPREVGVCTDVVIRAYRDAFNLDLQKKVHEDMRINFPSYPKIWGLKRPDKNIDHRRVPNLERFFTRMNARLEISKNPRDYRPGDLISSRLPGNLPHIAIVSHRPNYSHSRPLIIHNIGAGTRIEDGLFDYKIVGHFRYVPVG